jgi:prepilin-type N-terminal cleavage/methylation domain-containing protein
MRQPGLTLSEIIVSLVIISLTMAGLANIFVSAKRHIMHARSRMTSTELGKYFVDPLQMDVRQDTWDNNNLSAPLSYAGPSQTIERINYRPFYNVTNVNDTTLRRVVVDILWNETTPP